MPCAVPLATCSLQKNKQGSLTTPSTFLPSAFVQAAAAMLPSGLGSAVLGSNTPGPLPWRLFPGTQDLPQPWTADSFLILPLFVSLEIQEATSQAEWHPSIQGSEAQG